MLVREIALQALNAIGYSQPTEAQIAEAIRAFNRMMV